MQSSSAGEREKERERGGEREREPLFRLCWPPEHIAATRGSLAILALLVGVGVAVSLASGSRPAGNMLMKEEGTPDSTIPRSGLDPPVTQRETTLDNARFMIQTMVGFGHMLLGEVLGEGMSMDIENVNIGTVFYISFVSNMPMVGFSFLSGFASRRRPTRKHYQSLLINVVAALWLYTLLLLPMLRFEKGFKTSFGVLSYKHQDDLSVNSILRAAFINAAPSHTWFLQALVCWRLLTYLSWEVADITRVPKTFWLLVTSSLLCSIGPLTNYEVWSFQYVVYFLPSFLAGQFFPIQELLNMVPPSWSLKTAGFGILAFWCALSSGFVSNRFSLWFHMLPWKDAHGTTAATCPSPLLWTEGLCKVLITLSVFLIFLVTVCPRCNTIFAQRMKDRSMYAYLLHGFPVQGVILALYFFIPGVQLAKWSLNSWYWIVRILVQSLITFWCTSDSVVVLLSPIIQPVWLEDLIFGPPNADASKPRPMQ